MVLGDQLGWDMRREAVIDRILSSVEPHPDLGKPRLWALGNKDRGAQIMDWPLRGGAEVLAEAREDSSPTPAEKPSTGGVVPFPGWDFFDTDDTFDLDEATRRRTLPRTRSVPGRVPTDPIELRDVRRFGVPTTLLMGSLDEPTFRRLVAGWGPHGDEFAAIADAEVVKLGTAHWPQFSAPDRLGTAIVDAIAR